MNIHRRAIGLVALLAPLLLAGCGYNNFQRLDEQVKAAWAEVLSQGTPPRPTWTESFVR